MGEQSDCERALRASYEITVEVRAERDELRGELANLYGHLRALVTTEPGDWKHAVEGLLPEGFSRV